MDMRYSRVFTLALAAALVLAACSGNYTKYEGPSYIAFSDTLNVCPVRSDGGAFDVMIASTKSRGHDRTFGVEVVSSESNAVFGYHFTIPEQTVTIPAGERSAKVSILADYDKIGPDDSLSVTLSLVSAEDEYWDLYGQKTRVLLKKVCPFDIADFSGYCRVTSSFWMQYGQQNLERVVKVDLLDGENDAVVVRDFLMEGFDLEMRFDNSDILNPVLRLDEGQVVGDTRVPFNYIYGDGRIRFSNPGMANPVYVCERVAYVYGTLYVDEVGSIGTYVSVLEWLTDDEAAGYEDADE